MTENRTAVAGPPVARREPRTRVIHGETLVDPYAWLQRRDDPEVRAYLEAENAFTAESMRHAEPLVEGLYRELLGRLVETDSSVPVQVDDFEYYSRTVRGQQYPIHCRRRVPGGGEEVLLDLNLLGAGRRFLDLGAFSVSPDHRFLAYSLNDDGSERFTLRVLDLESFETVGEAIENTSPSVVWANDGKTFFYVGLSAARRPFEVFRHVLGHPAGTGVKVCEEPDERFFVSLFKTRSRRYLGIRIRSNVTTELRVLDAETPELEFRPVAERAQGVELDVDHHDGAFYLLTNSDAVNFKLMKVPLDLPGPRRWTEVVPHRPDVQLEAVDCFRRHLVIRLRRDGLRRLRVLDLESGDGHEIAFDEPAYTVMAEGNRTYDTSVLRFAYSSLVTPRSIYDYDMTTRERVLRKRTEVLGGYDPGEYLSQRIYARSADGTRVPISLVRRRDSARDGSHPALLSAYGAYGTSNEPRFVASRLSLLERGFVVAIAHVRGGGELGRAWYEDGKLHRKQRTFDDFVAAAEHLAAEGYTSPERLAIRGGSAGGLLIGAVLNQRPGICAVAVADVPFVDILNTMLDVSIPLTVTEFEEWGNPADARDFEVIRRYSPYDNVAEVEYPHLLITAGLNDSRVQYWEPAKWTAKLRALKKGRRRLLLKIQMDSGHSGASGRYDALREEAFRLAFVLDSLGVFPPQKGQRRAPEPGVG